MLRKAAFIVRLAAQDLKGNLAIHAVAAAIISAAFLTVGVFMLVAGNLRAINLQWQEKIQVCVYLEDGLEDAARQALKTRLQGLSGVKKIEYIDKDQALLDFKKMLGQDAGLLEGLDQNPLPESFTLILTPEMRTYEKIKPLSDKIAGWKGVDEVDYGGDWVEGFTSAVRVAQSAVVLIGGLIVLAIVFIISNTIRLTMFSRKEEIGIMKLVGASNFLIQLPFVIEGMVQGTAASMFGVVMLWALFRIGAHTMSWPGVFAGFQPVFISETAMITLIAGGAVLGIAGSISRVSSFLRA